MRGAWLVTLVVAMVLSPRSWGADAPAPYGNWFKDPFFQVRDELAACPRPKGPYSTEAEATAESHYRIERGTSCFLAGQCKKPNAYMYDAGIAAEVRARFADTQLVPHATLWVTVKRRFVWVEGCKAADQSLDGLEALLKSIPDVQLVLINVADEGVQRLPYDVLPPGVTVTDAHFD